MCGTQKRTLFLRHRLSLVTTSHECASHAVADVPRTALQTMDDGDAMAASPAQASHAQADILTASERSVPAMQVRSSSNTCPSSTTMC